MNGVEPIHSNVFPMLPATVTDCITTGSKFSNIMGTAVSTTCHVFNIQYSGIGGELLPLKLEHSENAFGSVRVSLHAPHASVAASRLKKMA